MGDDFNAFVDLAKSLSGFQDLDELWLGEVWEGAGQTVNIAINHVLDGEVKRRRAPGAADANRPAQPDVKLSIRKMLAAIVAARLDTQDLVERPHVEERYQEALRLLAAEKEPEDSKPVQAPSGSRGERPFTAERSC